MSYRALIPGHLKEGDLLSPKQVAEILGVSVRTVARWAKNGRLPGMAVLGPRVRRFRVGELRKALDCLERSIPFSATK